LARQQDEAAHHDEDQEQHEPDEVENYYPAPEISGLSL
jgi:hypothetical protein